MEKNRIPRKLKKKLKRNQPKNFMQLLIPDEYDLYFSQQYKEPPYPLKLIP
jgi:hypothetical protein